MCILLQGDSGGPLVCKDTAVGIVSFYGSEDCKSTTLPYVYTKISKFLPWINIILGKKEWVIFRVLSFFYSICHVRKKHVSVGACIYVLYQAALLKVYLNNNNNNKYKCVCSQSMWQ